MFPIKRKWNKKPNYPVGINWGNPLSKGLIHQSLFNKPFSDITNITPIINSGVSRSFTNRDGKGYHFDGTSSAYMDYGAVTFTDNSVGLCFEVIFQLDTLATEQKLIAKWGSTTSSQVFLVSVLASGAIQVAYQKSSTYIVGATAGGIISTGNKYHILLEAVGSNWNFWVNGVSYAVTGDSAPFDPPLQSTEPLYYGRDAGGSYITGDIYLVRIYDNTKVMFNGKAKSLYVNPYQILKPRTTYIPVAAAAGFKPYYARNATVVQSLQGLS